MKYVDKMQQDMPDEKEMEAWDQWMEARANDPDYFKTPQGKKDKEELAQLKKILVQKMEKSPWKV
jgi:hypothetical protein